MKKVCPKCHNPSECYGATEKREWKMQCSSCNHTYEIDAVPKPKAGVTNTSQALQNIIQEHYKEEEKND